MSKPNFKEVTRQLLPECAIYSGDYEDVEELLEANSLGFAKYFDWLTDVSDSLPDNKEGPLYNRWRNIFMTKDISTKILEFGEIKDETRIYQTKAHYQKVFDYFGYNNVEMKLTSTSLIFTIGPGVTGKTIHKDLASILLKITPAHLAVRIHDPKNNKKEEQNG